MFNLNNKKTCYDLDQIHQQQWHNDQNLVCKIKDVLKSHHSKESYEWKVLTRDIVDKKYFVGKTLLTKVDLVYKKKTFFAVHKFILLRHELYVFYQWYKYLLRWLNNKSSQSRKGKKLKLKLKTFSPENCVKPFLLPNLQGVIWLLLNNSQSKIILLQKSQVQFREIIFQLNTIFNIIF